MLVDKQTGKRTSDLGLKLCQPGCVLEGLLWGDGFLDGILINADSLCNASQATVMREPRCGEEVQLGSGRSRLEIEPGDVALDGRESPFGCLVASLDAVVLGCRSR